MPPAPHPTLPRVSTPLVLSGPDPPRPTPEPIASLPTTPSTPSRQTNCPRIGRSWNHRRANSRIRLSPPLAWQSSPSCNLSFPSSFPPPASRLPWRRDVNGKTEWSKDPRLKARACERAGPPNMNKMGEQSSTPRSCKHRVPLPRIQVYVNSQPRSCWSPLGLCLCMSNNVTPAIYSLSSSHLSLG